LGRSHIVPIPGVVLACMRVIGLIRSLGLTLLLLVRIFALELDVGVEVVGHGGGGKQAEIIWSTDAFGTESVPENRE
jgi:hypothetical protein